MKYYIERERKLIYIEKNNEKVDAIILTHVDNDHIQGALDGLGRMSAESLGQVEEKNLSEKLVSCTISGDIVELSGGAKLGVISPGWNNLKICWTNGMNTFPNIIALRMQPGLVLSNYSDCEYGRLVRKCKYQRGEFSEELIEASCERLTKFIKEHNITWITYIPSLNRPHLAKNFAKSVALHFQMPIKDAIMKLENAVEQKTLTNSVQQFHNAYDSFVCTDEVLAGNVLLIDDMVDSRWTLTVCSSRKNGMSYKNESQQQDFMDQKFFRKANHRN